MGHSGLEHAFEDHHQNSVKGEYLNQLVKSELDPDRKRILANLLSRDFVLGNLTAEETHEFKWQIWVIREKFLAMHPSEGSAIRGTFRAWLHDDPDAALEPLSQQEKHQVDQFFHGVWTRITRSKESKQQEIMSTSISESYVQRGDTNESGGLLNRWRS